MTGLTDLKRGPSAHEDSDYVERARSLRALIEAEADETERTGNLTARTVDALASTGLFWMLVPAAWGGGGQDIVTYFEVLEELSCADASTGWALMANATAGGIVSGFLNDDGADVLFGGDRLAIIAGQFGPLGKGTRTSDGYLVGGNYQFGSGSNHADWIGGGYIVMEDGRPAKTPEGPPEMRVALVPREQVAFKGNWDVTGLRGTGSVDYQIPEQEVPLSLTMPRVVETPQRAGLVYGVGTLGIGVGGHCGVVLGIMKRALLEIARITAGKVRGGYPTTVDKHPLFLYEFSKHEALYQACRTYLLETYADVEATAAMGQPVSPAQRARLRQSATWSHQVLTDVVGFCHLWGTSQSIRNPSLLGRASRDAAVATQHVLFDQITLVDASAPILESWCALANSEY